MDSLPTFPCQIFLAKFLLMGVNMLAFLLTHIKLKLSVNGEDKI